MAFLCFTIVKAYSITITYPTSGSMNGSTLFVLSAIYPMSRNPHPPIGVIIISDDALFVSEPRSLTASEKIVGNIIASKR